VRFIALLNPFDPTQERFRGEKNGSSRLKCHLDSEAWVLRGEVSTMENCAGCNEGLVALPGEVDVRFIALLSPFDPTQDCFRVEKAGSGHLKYHLDSAAWVLPDIIHTMES
jgi:hypothetical protein